MLFEKNILIARARGERTFEPPKSERVKTVGDRWNNLPKEDKDVYAARFKKENEQYKIDIEAFYKKHPEEKLKDEQEAAAAREKRAAGKEPAGLKADEKNIKIFYFTAYVKKYRDIHKPDYLPPTPNAKKMIAAAYKKLCDDGEQQVWMQKWSALTTEDKLSIKKFYEQWLKIKAK